MKKLIPLIAILFAATCMVSCSKSSDSNKGGAVTISSMQFTPNTLTITAGTTVMWTNNDNTVHTVTSTTGIFDSGNIPLGGNYKFTFANKGTYPYKCTIHPTMTGTIIVN